MGGKKENRRPPRCCKGVGNGAIDILPHHSRLDSRLASLCHNRATRKRGFRGLKEDDMRHAAMYLGLALSGISSLSAQKTGLPSMGAGSASGSNTGSVSGPPPQSSQSSNPGMSPETQMPVFISGRVMMEDGTPPPTSIAIQRTCSGSPRTVAYTNSKGQFN